MRTLTIITLLTALSFVMGCGKPYLKTEPVQGMVTLDGAPLSGASLMFTPKGGVGTASYGLTDAEGKYKLQTLQGLPDAGTTPGEYVVTITKSVADPAKKTFTVDADGNRIESEVHVQILPAVYAEYNKSILSATVVSGKNEFNFDLKSKP